MKTLFKTFSLGSALLLLASCTPTAEAETVDPIPSTFTDASTEVATVAPVESSIPTPTVEAEINRLEEILNETSTDGQHHTVVITDQVHETEPFVKYWIEFTVDDYYEAWYQFEPELGSARATLQGYIERMIYYTKDGIPCEGYMWTTDLLKDSDEPPVYHFEKTKEGDTPVSGQSYEFWYDGQMITSTDSYEEINFTEELEQAIIDADNSINAEVQPVIDWIMGGANQYINELIEQGY